MDRACQVIEAFGLTLVSPYIVWVRAAGDFASRGRFFLLCGRAEEPMAKHICLYPTSFARIFDDELIPVDSLTRTPSSPPRRILSLQPTAVYASFLRMLNDYSRGFTRVLIDSDFSDLCMYGLLGVEHKYPNEDDPEEWERWGMNQRIKDAVTRVAIWQWRKGEESFGKILTDSLTVLEQ
jgi:hypothetical protein